MGFFDTVKAKAGDLAADAERASKVAAIQARIAVLQQDLKKAERELGQATFSLVERGELSHPELALAVDGVRAAQAAIDAKETEIAQLRTDEAAATSAAPPAAEAPVTPAAAEASVPPPPAAAPASPDQPPTPPPAPTA